MSTRPGSQSPWKKASVTPRRAMTARTVLVLAASLKEGASGSAGEFIDEILWDICASTRHG